MSKTSLAGVVGFSKQSARDIPAKGPYNSTTFVAGSNEVHTITITGTPTGGDFNISEVGGDANEADVDFDITLAALKTVLEGFSTIGVGNVTVTGTPGTSYVITYINELAHLNVPSLVVDDAGLTGGTTPAAALVATAGVPDVGDWTYIPALTANFQQNQIVSAIPPEVGGSDYSRGSYKGGVSGQGQITFVPRGGLGLAELFRGMSGSMVKTSGDGTNGAAIGNFIYVFTPSLAGVELPWYTFIRNVAGATVEEFADTRVGSLAFDMAATGILNFDGSFVSRKCGNIAKGAPTTGPAAQVAGNGPKFQAVDTQVKLDTNNSGTVGPLAPTPYKPTRLSIGFMNQLTSDEFVVGSHFLEDVTKVARTCQIGYGLRLRDAEIYNRVYNHGFGSADGSTDAAWNTEVWKGALYAKFRSDALIGATSDRYTITVEIPEMDYQAAMLPLQGNSVVEFQLTTNVVLSEDPNVEPFTITYVTDEDI